MEENNSPIFSQAKLEYAKQWYLAGYKHMSEQYPDGNYPWIK